MVRTPQQKAQDRDAARKNARDILTFMQLARLGDEDAVALVLLYSRLKKFRLDVEACRGALCKKLGLAEKTPLVNLLTNKPIPKMHQWSENEGVRIHEFLRRHATNTVTCTQCDAVAIPGDDRCYFHIK